MADMEEHSCPNCRNGLFGGSSGEITCPRCAGAGHLRWPNGDGKCRQCQGTGKITCAKCGGSGSIYSRKRDDDDSEDGGTTITTASGGSSKSGCWPIIIGIFAFLLVMDYFLPISTLSKFENWVEKLFTGQQSVPVETRPQVQPSQRPSSTVPPSPPRQQPERQSVTIPPTQPQMRFAPVIEEYPRPNPLPVTAGRHPTNGDLLFNWGGMQWRIPDVIKPYRYLCVINNQLRMCWPNPPNAAAAPCARNSDNAKGWCWKE